MEKQTDTELVHDPEPERYYDWMLWKLRQEKTLEMDENYDKRRCYKKKFIWQICKLKFMNCKLFGKEIAEMQKTNHS